MRADGKVVKNVDPMYTLATYFMRERYDAQNMIKVTVPYEPIHDYVIEARKNGHRISHMSVVLAAFIRTISEFPALNRFVVNSRIYARNELSAGMVVLRPGDADPSMSKMYFDLYDTVFTVNDKVEKYIDDNNKSSSKNSSDELFAKLLRFPMLVRMIMAIYRFGDKHGLLPKSLLDASPFHNSFVITNLASIRTNYIYHHVYGFGTTSIILSIGTNIDTPKMRNGEIVLEKEMPFGIVMDERIANGSYYANAFSRMHRYLRNPELLELPPESVNVDYEFEGLSERFKKEPKKSKKEKKKKAEKPEAVAGE